MIGFTGIRRLARGTGFLARFLLAWPESTQGHRPFTDPPESWPALARFNKRIAGILEQNGPINEDGALSPPILPLAADTKSAWVTFHDAIEGELRPSGELYDVRDVASKTADNAARIATLFQLFEHGSGGAIGLAAFEGASRIAAWHLHEARRFYGELALPEEQADAVLLDDWLLDYCRREETNIVPRREVQRNVTPGYLRQKAALDIALDELMEASGQGATGSRRQAQGDSHQSVLTGRGQAMTLSALIKKGGLTGGVTATPATPATQEADKPVTVAPVATVAVAISPEPKTIRPENITPSIMTAEDEDAIRNWLIYVEETNPAVIAEVLDKCRTDAGALVYFLRRSKEASILHTFDDDRRYCAQCANLTQNGLCLAAWRGEIKASQTFHPVSHIPRRCEGYLSGTDDPDRRSGRERWPNLNHHGVNYADDH